jgi:hypothetical protein
MYFNFFFKNSKKIDTIDTLIDKILKINKLSRVDSVSILDIRVDFYQKNLKSMSSRWMVRSL